MQTFIPPDMLGVLARQAHRAEADVVSLCLMADVPVVMEIFERLHGSLGFRYVAKAMHAK